MGYDTTQMAEWIESKVLAFSSDMIIIGYCLNDIGILSRESSVLSLLTFPGMGTRSSRLAYKIISSALIKNRLT